APGPAPRGRYSEAYLWRHRAFPLQPNAVPTDLRATVADSQSTHPNSLCFRAAPPVVLPGALSVIACGQWFASTRPAGSEVSVIAIATDGHDPGRDALPAATGPGSHEDCLAAQAAVPFLRHCLHWKSGPCSILLWRPAEIGRASCRAGVEIWTVG